MPEPRTITTDKPSALARLMARAVAQHLQAGPVDDQPSPDEPGHPEYHRRRRAEFALTRWHAATPYRYQDATAHHPAIQTWADTAAADPRAAGALVLTGSVGNGKTHQAYGALRRIAATGPRDFAMIATTAPDMYGRLRPGGNSAGTEHELERLCRIPFLLLDDLGAEKLTEWTEEATYRLVNGRYNQCRPLIVTTNHLVRAQSGQRDLVTRLGDRLASRLAQDATVVHFDGPDLRRQNRNTAA